MECSICLNDVKANEQYKSQCGHTFHHACMIHWLSTKNSCPVCRFPLYTYNKQQVDHEHSEIEYDINSFIILKNPSYKYIFTSEMEEVLLDAIDSALENMTQYKIDMFDTSALEACYTFNVKGTKLRVYYFINKCPNKNIYVIELTETKTLANKKSKVKTNYKYLNKSKYRPKKHYF